MRVEKIFDSIKTIFSFVLLISIISIIVSCEALEQDQNEKKAREMITIFLNDYSNYPVAAKKIEYNSFQTLKDANTSHILEHRLDVSYEVMSKDGSMVRARNIFVFDPGLSLIRIMFTTSNASVLESSSSKWFLLYGKTLNSKDSLLLKKMLVY